MQIFKGKKYLVFEKSSNCIGSGVFPSYFVRTIVNLGFTKLVQRVRATGYSEEALAWASKVFHHTTTIDFGEQNAHRFRDVFCYGQNGDTLGSIYELSVLMELDVEHQPELPSNVLFSNKLKAYIGFSRKYAALFKLGDRIFDPGWFPESWEEIPLGSLQEYCKRVGYKNIPQSIDEAKTFVKLRQVNGGYSILKYIPFNRRGSKVIECHEHAVTAAKKFAEYASSAF
jgi:hypothetical protein